MGEVFIVRHGQCTDGARGVMAGELDPDLSALGEQQALKAAKNLASLLIDSEVALYSSTKNRAVQTAERIAAVLGVETFLQFPALDERRLGRFTGLTVPQALSFIDPLHIIDMVHTKFVEHPSYGCETFAQVEARVRPFASYIRQTYEQTEQSVVVAMHGDSGRALAGVLTGQGMADMLDFPFNNGDILHVQDASVERLAA